MHLKKMESLKTVKALFEHPFLAVYQQNGLNASESTALKQHLQQSNLEIKSVKNTAVQVALKGTPYGYFCNLFEGPCMVISSKELHEKTSAMFSLHKKFTKLIPLGALLQKGYLSAQEFEGMASVSHINHIYLSIADLCMYPSMDLAACFEKISGEIPEVLENQKS